MENGKADKMTSLSYVAITISILSAAAAIFSCIFAYKSLSASKSQFTVLNQAYLNVKPELHFTSPNNNSRLLSRVSQISDDLLIDGLNPKLKMENVGKLPLKYDVKDFTILLDNKKQQNIERAGRTTGVIYPDQTATFELATVTFDYFRPARTISFGSLKKIKITSTIQIAYSDFGAEETVKYCDRILEWTVYDNVIKYVWTSINDTI